MMNSWRKIPFTVWRILIHSMLIGLGMSFFDVLFNFYLVSIGYAADTAGILSTTARIAGLVVGIPGGMLIDRIGARRALITAVLIYVVGLSCVVFAPTTVLLIASQFVVGCAFALLFAALFPLLTVTTPHAQQTAAFGLNEAALNMIGLVGSIVAGWLPTVIAPWLQASDQSAVVYRVVLLIGVAILGLSTLPLIGHLEEAGERDADGVLTDGANIAAHSNWTILKYGMAGFLMGVGSGTFFPFQSLFFRMQFDLPDAQVGTILAFSGVSLGLGAVLAGHYIGKRSLRVWAGSFRILAAPMLLLMLSPVLWLSVFGFIVRALLIGGSISLNDVLTMRLVNPQQRGFASSIWNMQWAAGWAITATLSGFVQTSYGFTPLLILGAIAYVLSSISIWQWQRDSA
jgi:MFS family permease